MVPFRHHIQNLFDLSLPATASDTFLEYSSVPSTEQETMDSRRFPSTVYIYRL
jgi:hypothetical protein